MEVLDRREGRSVSEAATDAASRRLLIVSNRGPIEHYVSDDGRLRRRSAGGGLATAMGCAADSLTTTWIACAASPADRDVAAEHEEVELMRGSRLRLVAPSAEAWNLHYRTFCNPILWFLQHGLWGGLDRPNESEQTLEAWERGYLPVNQAIAEAVVDELRRCGGRGRVMLHDYHLYTAPLLIRNVWPRATLQHFIHIPWPHPEAWEQLPSQIVTSICDGLLANDSVVLQTEASARNFLETCRRYLPECRVDDATGTVRRGWRRTLVWANPISIDPAEVLRHLSSPGARAYYDALRGELGERTIVRVDRLDPAKNVLAGLQAFRRLLTVHPEWLGRVRFLAFLVPSRTRVPEYQSYKEAVFAAAESINAQHGRDGWTPIKLFYEHNRPQALVALSLYDVLLVNSVADGMNLVAKEGAIANQRDGVLVLSTAAGAFEELGAGSLPVRPDDVEGTAAALHEALSLPESERRRRAHLLRQTVLRHDLSNWLRRQLEDLCAIETESAALAMAR